MLISLVFYSVLFLLSVLKDRHKFDANNIWKVHETGVALVQKPHQKKKKMLQTLEPNRADGWHDPKWENFSLCQDTRGGLKKESCQEW